MRLRLFFNLLVRRLPLVLSLQNRRIEMSKHSRASR